MSDIKLLKIHMENFMGAKDLTIEFSDGVTKITGPNGSCKSTIFHAFTWLMFNKDSYGREKFSIRTLDADAREGVLDYLAEMTLFEEVEVKGKNYLLVHAGIADYDPDTDLEDYQPEDFFSEALDASYELIEGTTVIVGHVPTRSGKIERGEGSIFLNCGVAEGGKLACLCLESGEEFYV